MRRPIIAAAIAVLIAAAVFAQEPRPVTLASPAMADPDGVALDFAWRYAPGDAAGRESIDYDDSRWIPVLPLMQPGQHPPWTGVGWFRRHMIVDPSLEGRTL